MVLALVTAATLAFHYYDVLFEPFLGQFHFMHAIHGRLCYIPIVLGAFWFGLRGGIITAIVISIFSFIYIYIQPFTGAPHEVIGEYTEIAFYLAIAGLAGVLLDIERVTRRKKEEAERKLLQAERLSMMGQMVASIAHEIKNPLGSIKGAVQILKDKSTPSGDKAEFTSIIEKEVDRLDNVVRDYLTYARPVPTVPSDTDICQVIYAAIRQITPQCDQHQIKIAFAPEQLPHIQGDSARLHQLFLNIFLNAIQAMPSGGEISVRCRVTSDDSNSYLETLISDSGPGIPSENLPKIFEPFYSTKAHGTGLGLATAKTIVTEHEGTIRAESASGQGTTFVIALPLNNTGRAR